MVGKKSIADKVVVCGAPDCGKQFRMEGDHDHHVKANHPNTQFVPCVKPGCSERFNTFGEAKKHNRVRHVNVVHVMARAWRLTCIRHGGGKYDCPVFGCTMESPDGDQVNEHVLKDHQSDMSTVNFKPGVTVELAAKGQKGARWATRKVATNDDLIVAQLALGSTSGTAAKDSMDVDTAPSTMTESGGLLPASDVEGVVDVGWRVLSCAKLASVGYIVLEPPRVAVCLACKIGIEPKKLGGHVHDAHRDVYDGVKKSIFDEIVAAYELPHPKDVTTPTFFRAPSPLLAPPVSGFYCTICHCDDRVTSYAAPSTNTLNDHYRLLHSERFGVGNNASHRGLCKLQSLFNFKGWMHYFAVDCTLAEAPREGALTPLEKLKKRTSDALPAEEDRVLGEPIDARNLTAFLYSMKWPLDIVGCNPYELAALVSLPGDFEPFSDLAASVKGYFVKIAKDEADGLSIMNRRAIQAKTDELTSHAFNGGLLAKDSVYRYTNDGVRLLLFLIRSRMNSCPSFPVHFDDVQTAALDALLAGNTANAITSDLIHDVLYSIVNSEVKDIGSKPRSHPIQRFLIVYSRQPDGNGWQTMADLSSGYARLEWVMRCVVIYDVLSYSSKSDGNRNEALQERLKFIRKDNYHPFAHICETKSVVTRIIEGSPKEPNVVLMRNRRDIQVNGRAVNLSALKDGFRSLLDSVTNMFYQNVLWNHSFPEVVQMMKSILDPFDASIPIYDDCRNRERGYTFFDDRRNPFHKYRYLLLEKFMDPAVNTITGREPLYTDTGDDNLLLNVNEVRKFFTHLDEFITAFVSAFMLVTVPFRSPEWATLTLSKLEDGERSLVMTGGRLVVIAHYRKARSVSETDDLNPKAFPDEMAVLFLLYITLVLPVVEHFAETQFGEDALSARAAYKQYVFVKNGKRFADDDFFRALETGTEQYCGGKLHVSTYRHVIKTILLYFCKADGDTVHRVTADEDEPVNAAFGHTDSVGRREYAVIDESVPVADAPTFNKILDVSNVLHSFFGVGIPDATVRTDGTMVAAPTERAVVSSIVSGVISGINRGFEGFTTAQILPALRNLTLDSATTLAGMMSMLDRLRESPSSLVPAETEYGHKLHPRVLRELRLLSGDRDATFRTREQVVAVDGIDREVHHMLLIQPCAQGKSFLGILSAVLAKRGVTVFISPFVGLLADQKARMASYPTVTWASYPSRDIDLENTRIVFVQVEIVTLQETILWLRQVASTGLLNRIIFDEAHVALLDKNYRECLRELRHLSIINAPMVLLTATISSKSEDALVETFGLDPKMVRRVRSPCTSPPNIIYEVMKVDRYKMMDAAIKCMNSEFVLDGKGRGIVWVVSTKDGFEFQKRTGVSYAYGGPECDKDAILREWKEGTWIVSTTCLSHGINFPDVEYCIFLGAPFDLTMERQMSGRIGRDGRVAKSRIYFSGTSHLRKKAEENRALVDHGGASELQAALDFPGACRRIRSSLFFDGYPYECTTMTGAQLCDLCSERCNKDDALEARVERSVLPLPLPIQLDEDDEENGEGEDAWQEMDVDMASDLEPVEEKASSSSLAVAEPGAFRDDGSSWFDTVAGEVSKDDSDETDSSSDESSDGDEFVDPVEGAKIVRRQEVSRSQSSGSRTLESRVPSLTASSSGSSRLSLVTPDTSVFSSMESLTQQSKGTTKPNTLLKGKKAKGVPFESTMTLYRSTTSMSSSDLDSSRSTVLPPSSLSSTLSLSPVKSLQPASKLNSKGKKEKRVWKATSSSSSNGTFAPVSSIPTASSTIATVGNRVPSTSTTSSGFSAQSSATEFTRTTPGTSSISGPSKLKSLFGGPSRSQHSIVMDKAARRIQVKLEKIVEVIMKLDIEVGKGVCPQCIVLNQPVEQYPPLYNTAHTNLYECTIEIEGVRIGAVRDDGLFGNFKNVLHANLKLRNEYCAYCLLRPQTPNHYVKGMMTRKCTYDDRMKPLVYALYYDQRWRTEIFTSIDPNFFDEVDSVKAYAGWCCRPYKDSSVLNCEQVAYRFGVDRGIIVSVSDAD